MALLHQATLTPTKAELVAAWLPQQDWFDGDATQVRPTATFRFDDPEGEVGLEVILLADGDRLWLTPMSYRAEPLDGGAAHLIGTTEHSVLGTRYVYDALGDPVFVDVARRVITDGGTEAALERDLGDGTTEPVTPTMTAHGTGGDGVDLVVDRTPETASEADLLEGAGALLGHRDGHRDLVLARLL